MSSVVDFKIFGKPLAAYAEEVLRWNRRINLVSRQDTETLVGDLFRQCTDGAEALWASLAEEGWNPGGAESGLKYFDLGSGGGFPGVIWHEWFFRQTAAVQTCLVEPRDKRAWFLNRVSGMFANLESKPFLVHEGRWGEGSPDFPDNPHHPADQLVIVSLKALHLTDPEVLEGLGRIVLGPGSPRVAIARFYPADQLLDEELREKLDIAPVGGVVDDGLDSMVGAGARILSWTQTSPKRACLVLTLYVPGMP